MLQWRHYFAPLRLNKKITFSPTLTIMKSEQRLIVMLHRCGLTI